MLTLIGSRLGTNVNVPRVRIDGEWQKVSYGENTWTLRAGPHRVDVDMFHVVTYGRASAEVDVAPDVTTQLYYSPPHHQLASARLGAQPQPRAGADSSAIFVFVVIVVIGLLIFLTRHV